MIPKIDFTSLDERQSKDLLSAALRIGKERFGLVTVSVSADTDPHPLEAGASMETKIDDKMEEEQLGFEKPKKTKKRRREVTVNPLKLNTNNSFGILQEREQEEKKQEVKIEDEETKIWKN